MFARCQDIIYLCAGPHPRAPAVAYAPDLDTGAFPLSERFRAGPAPHGLPSLTLRILIRALSRSVNDSARGRLPRAAVAYAPDLDTGAFPLNERFRAGPAPHGLPSLMLRILNRRAVLLS